ncbi:MAG: hypothetical protein OEW19_15490 [Acidobacteriota bacterium]|nr:hypothetical protein [Acidobacteriota bacterium]
MAPVEAGTVAGASVAVVKGGLVRWTRALLGGTVLTPASDTEMTTAGVLNEGTNIR